LSANVYSAAIHSADVRENPLQSAPLATRWLQKTKGMNHMIDVELLFFPPGRGAVDYTATAKLPALPQKGDCLTISDPDETGAAWFIVRRIAWMLDRIQEGGSAAMLRNRAIVECEIARGPIMSKSHEDSCKMYEARGLVLCSVDDWEA
jgi:hypothetical protein